MKSWLHQVHSIHPGGNGQLIVGTSRAAVALFITIYSWFCDQTEVVWNTKKVLFIALFPYQGEPLEASTIQAEGPRLHNNLGISVAWDVNEA